MFEIQQAIISAWTTSRKVKYTTSKWISANAVCCHHLGHNTDTKGRGGLLPTEEGGVSYHCFNCGFTASWKPGRRITLKMRRFLQWLNVDEDEIRRLSLFALSQLDTTEEIQKETVKELPKIEVGESCPGQMILYWFADENISGQDQQQIQKIIEYLDNRGLSNKLERFYWHNDSDSMMYNRVLVPFTFLNQPAGYTGRLIYPGQPKYYSSKIANYVFNYDYQKPTSKFCLVVEGIFDAIAIDGLAISSNECSENQALIIDSLNREVIVIPDRDKAGQQLVRDAMTYGWNVSFPDWHNDIKDCADAVQKYGQLFTMKSILNSVETSNLKIQLKMKRWFS
jgi:hypothetical protein